MTLFGDYSIEVISDVLDHNTHIWYKCVEIQKWIFGTLVGHKYFYVKDEKIFLNSELTHKLCDYRLLDKLLSLPNNSKIKLIVDLDII